MVGRDSASKCDMAASEAEISDWRRALELSESMNLEWLSPFCPRGRIHRSRELSAAEDGHAGDRETTILTCASNWPIKRHPVSTASEPLRNTPYIPAGCSKEIA